MNENLNEATSWQGMKCEWIRLTFLLPPLYHRSLGPVHSNALHMYGMHPLRYIPQGNT